MVATAGTEVNTPTRKTELILFSKKTGRKFQTVLLPIHAKNIITERYFVILGIRSNSINYSLSFN